MTPSTEDLRARRVALLHMIARHGSDPALVAELAAVGVELVLRSGGRLAPRWNELTGIGVGGGPARRCGRAAG